MLTQERLKQLLSYDVNTGLFTRIVGVKGAAIGEVAGVLHKASGYVYIGIDGERHRAHRLAWFYVTGEWPLEIDHKNGIRSDNRLANLRMTTRSLNNANSRRRSDNSSGHKGVNWVGRVSRWRAYITENKKQRHLGYFSSIDDAVAARKSAARSSFGEFMNE